MRMSFGILTGNAVLDCGLLAWFMAQVAKVFLGVVLLKKFDFHKFVASGGMPSSHSALVVACTTAIGKLYGTSGPYFAVSAVFSAVVMYDACNVRRSAGDTVRVVNLMLEHVEKLTAEEFAENLKEVMGHTPLQVLVGALLGLVVGLLV